MANDIQRRNTIAILLQDWNLISVVKKEAAEDKAPLSQIKVLGRLRSSHPFLLLVLGTLILPEDLHPL